MILPRPILLDANALIYLDKIGIVRKVISLLSENGADPFTTNLVKQEMKVPSWKVLEGCGMKWHEVWLDFCMFLDMCPCTYARKVCKTGF